MKTKTATRKRATAWQRALTLVLSAAMLFQLIAPMAAPQTAAADGAANSHGTYLQTFVGTTWLNAQQGIAAPPTAYVQANKLPTYDNGIDFACEPGAITKQSKLAASGTAGSIPGATVYLQTMVHWGAGEVSSPITAPTITLSKPANATFTIGADTGTQYYVAAVSASVAGTTVTISLKTGITYDNLFSINYSYTYNLTSTYDGMTADVTPTLNIPGSSAVTGDSLQITTACETVPYPGLQVDSVRARLNGSNDGFANFNANIDANTSPLTTQKARVSSAFTYRLYPVVQVKLPNQPYTTTNPNSVVGGNASIPRSATFTLTLPVEAQLVNGIPSGWTQSTDGSGRIVLTTSAWNLLNYFGFPASNTGFLAQPSSTGFQIYYTAPPANGTAYLYDTKVTGVWQDGTTFSEEKTDVPHLYETTPASLNFSMSVSQRVASVNGGGNDTSGYNTFSAHGVTSSLALGDHEAFVYSINNNLTGTTPSEVPLSDFTVTIPFQGDMWDIAHFMRIIPSTYDTITVTYSDGNTATFDTSDTTKFDVVAGADSGIAMCGSDPMSWLMDGKASSVYITQLSLHAAPGYIIPVGSTGLLGLEVVLRSERPDGSLVVPGVDVGRTSASVTASAPDDLTTNPMTRTASGASTTAPIYATQEDRPSSWGSWILSNLGGIPSSVTPGQSFTITTGSGFYVPDVSYNNRIPNPTLTLKLPESLTFDYANAQLLLGYGPMTQYSSGSACTSTRVLPAADYEVSTSSPGDGYTYYTFKYTGAADPNDANTGYISNNEDYRIFLKGTITVSDDAAAASAVPIRVDTTSPAIATAAPNANTGSTNIVVPTILSTALASSGDLIPNTWMKDTDNSVASPLDSNNLAKVKDSGTLRFQVINNTANATSGDVYVTTPVGTFTPAFVNASAETVNGSTTTDKTSDVIWYYTTGSYSDYSAAPTTAWTAFDPADPSTLPANASAIKISGASLAAGDRFNVYLNYDIPASAIQGQVARSIAQVNMGALQTKTLYAGFKVVRPSYIVNYYKDSIDPSNLLPGSSSIFAADYNSIVTLDGGTSDGQLDYKKPATGYFDGVQTPSSYTIADGDSTINIINVLYTKKDNLAYTVNYYKGSTSGGVSGANYLGSSDEVTDMTFGDPITLAAGTGNAELDAYLTDAGSGYSSGVQQDPKPYLIADGANIIDVVYPLAADIPVTVNYYTGSVALANQVGTTTIQNQSLGTMITLDTAQLNAYRPDGYSTGIQQDMVPYVVQASANVINVLYMPRTDITYTVIYWADSVGAGGTQLGTSAAVTGQTFGEGITLAAGIANAQLDAYLPTTGYNSGVQQDPKPYVLEVSGNTINVLYTKKTNLSYTVDYYIDSTTGGTTGANYLGSSTAIGGITFGTNIVLSAGTGNAQLDAYLASAPAGYASPGVQTPSAYSIIDGVNTINVIYHKATDIAVTINYYQDSVTTPADTDTFLGSDTLTGHSILDAITLSTAQLNAYQPTGYSAGTQQGALPYMVVASGNVINVLYMPRTDISYTVVYWQDAVGTGGTQLGTSSAVTGQTFGDGITLATGIGNAELDAYLPTTGYNSGVQQDPKPYVLDVSGNTINVLYTKKTNLSYTVDYYIDSTTGGTSGANYLGSSTAIGGITFGTNIVLASGTGNAQLDAYLTSAPAGYASPGIQTPSAYSIIDGVNTIDVIYRKATDIAVTVNYYQDSVTTPADTDTFLGSDTLTGHSILDAITLSTAQLNAYQPTGYSAGTQQGALPYMVVASGNVINVLYMPRTDITYTVVYWADSVGTGGTQLGTSTPVTGQTFGDKITLATGIANAQLDAYLPTTGYNSGVQQDPKPYVLDVSGNTINVLYTKKTNLSYTVDYYIDSTTGGTSGANFLGSSTAVGGQTFGTNIVLASGTGNAQLDAYLASAPAGYASPGVQTPSAHTIIDGVNTINVIYRKATDIAVTINYYQNSVTTPADSATFLGSDTLDNHSILDAITLSTTQLNAYQPTGYQAGTQEGTVPYIVVATGNVINVLYLPRTDISYQVIYWKDAIGTGGMQVGTSTLITGQTFGDKITLAAGVLDTQLDAYRLAGYNGGTQQAPIPYTLAVTGNTINVLYTAKTYEVDYDTNGADSGPIPAKTDVLWSDANLLPAQPTRTGYTFKGWNVTVGGTRTDVAATDAYSDLATDDSTLSLTLQAQWQINSYPVSYAYSGMVPTSAPLVRATATTDYGTTVDVAPAPVVAGYTFSGWTTTDATVNSGSFVMPDKAVTLTGTWTAKNYTVHYDTAGGDLATLPDKTGVLWSQAGLISDDNPTRVGYTFTGWTDNGRSVGASTPYSALVPDDTSAETTLTATWKIKTYPVTVIYYLSDNPGVAIATDTIKDQDFGATIAVGTTLLDAHKPAHGYTDGTSSSAPTYTVIDGTNVIKVYYTQIKYNIEIVWHTMDPSGTVIATEKVDPVYGQVIDPTTYLNKHKPAGFGNGIAVATPWTVTDKSGTNVFHVYYPDTAPVINVKRPVLYVRQPIKLTIADILRLAGVSITDAEEAIPLSKLTISGYSNIKWSVVNYPSGDGYQIKLKVQDTPGLWSPVATISIFVEPKADNVKPATPEQLKKLPVAPKNAKWGVDEDGNFVLYLPTASPKTPLADTSLPKTGDSVMLTTPVALVAAAAALLASRRRRKGSHS